MDKKILIVDDDRFYRVRERAFLLKRIPCTILEAGGGREALEIIRKEKPDLVMLDLFMPDMDGDECCSIIKGDPELCHTIVIMLSISEKTEDKKRCFFAGCDDFLTKPIHAVTLLEKLKQYLGIIFRSNVRIPLTSSVYFNYNDIGHSALIINIAQDGLLIKCSVNVPVDETIDARFNLPNIDRTIEAKCKVVRIEEEHKLSLADNEAEKDEEKEDDFTMAVKFLSVNEDLERAITELQHKYII